MESSIAEFLMRQLAYEQLPTFWLVLWQSPSMLAGQTLLLQLCTTLFPLSGLTSISLSASLRSVPLCLPPTPTCLGARSASVATVLARHA